MTDDKLRAEFEAWYAVHHPFDWWASYRSGSPLPSGDRLLVWHHARDAYAAGHRAGLERARKVCRDIPRTLVRPYSVPNASGYAQVEASASVCAAAIQKEIEK